MAQELKKFLQGDYVKGLAAKAPAAALIAAPGVIAAPVSGKAVLQRITVPIKEIQVTGRDTMEPGDRHDFTKKIEYADGSLDFDNQHTLLTWSSDRGDIVSVNEKTGHAVARQAGRATITAKDASGKSGKSGSITVTVKELALVKLDFRGESANPSIVGGGHVDFKVYGTYKNFVNNEYRQKDLYKNVKVAWKSSDENVAKFDSPGRASVKGVGTTTITATATAADGRTESAKTTLTVVPPGKGARKIKVNITALDHEGVGINGKGIAVFHSDENDLKVTIDRDIKGGTFSASATLMPTGWLEFHAIGKNGATPTSTARYTIDDPGTIWFRATQKEGKTTDEGEDERSKKNSKGKKRTDEKEERTTAQGGVGVNIKGVGVDASGSKEWGTKNTNETSEEQEDSTVRRDKKINERPLGLAGFNLKQEPKGGGKADDE